MKSLTIKKNLHFIGRKKEQEKLEEITKKKEATVITVFGRRRVGKTELIEQSLRTYKVLKFEGIQADPLVRDHDAKVYQITMVLKQLAAYTGNEYIGKLHYTNWYDVFDIIASLITKGRWILYFEEVQWLANYTSDFFSELKPIWDNKLRHNRELILVFCGSSPSFIMKELVSDKAFYNRSHEEIHLKEFSLREVREFLGKIRSFHEILFAYLLVGGIPEYLKYLKKESSVFLSICKHSFTPRSFFSIEKDKIFVSSLSTNKNFEKVITFLSVRKYATRDEIVRALKTKTGGYVTELLNELEACGFIERYTPVQLETNSIVGRYCITDSYLQYYYKFILPRIKDIENGDFEDNPTQCLTMDNVNKWLGFSFERYCRKNHRIIAGILGFGAVNYRAGAFFTRGIVQEKPGFQIDLMYMRNDNVMTICEIKYRQTKVGTSIIPEFEKKLELLKQELPNVKKATLSKVLITTHGAENSLIKRAYFDRILTLEDLFA